MVVGATRNNLVASFNECLSHCASVHLHLALVLLIARIECLAERNSLSCDYVFQRTALNTGEYGRVQDLRHFLYDALRSGQTPRVVEVLAHQDDTATRTAQSLVGCRGYNVCILHGVLQQTCCDQTCRMCHINQEQCANLICDLTHTFVVPLATVCRSSTNDQLGFVLHCQSLHCVVIDTTRSLIELITDGLKIHTRHIHRRTVRKVSAVRQIESHKGIARFQNSGKHSHICLCTRVGLNVCILSAVQLAQTVNSQLLDLIHYLTSAIVTCCGIAFCILVSKHRAHSLHNLIANEILRSDKFDTVHLTRALLGNQIKNLRVFFHKNLCC